MTLKFWVALTMLTGSIALAGCTPAVVGAAAVGATGALMADKAAEQDGDDGLF